MASAWTIEANRRQFAEAVEKIAKAEPHQPVAIYLTPSGRHVIAPKGKPADSWHLVGRFNKTISIGELYAEIEFTRQQIRRQSTKEKTTWQPST